MQLSPFTLIEPESGHTPVIVEVPHAGTCLDAESMMTLIAPPRSVARDADLYVDELVADASKEGASVLIARASRYVVDLNREVSDVDALSVEGGVGSSFPRGLVWRLTSDGKPALRAPLEQGDLMRRVEQVYRPYHRALSLLVDQKLQRFGRVVLLSMHSMPSVARDAIDEVTSMRADVVVGTRGRTTAAGVLIALVEEHVKSFGWSIAHDDPYRGGATTGRLGRLEQNTHAIQIELARRLYMDETTLERKPDPFAVARTFCRGLVARLGAVTLG